MRWIRAWLVAVRELARGPEGPTFEEVGHWAWRRAVLRTLLLPVVLPLVLLVLFGWPWVGWLRHQYAQPCGTLLTASEVGDWTGGEVARGPVQTGMYGCSTTWSRGEVAVLTVEVYAPGGSIVHGVADRLKRGRARGDGTVERMQTEGSAWATLLYEHGRQTAVVEVSDDPFALGATIVLTSDDGDPSELLPRALTRQDAAISYTTWLH